ncbi:MAG: AAA family ATPase [Bacteroidales bacterium]|nr:AAA family ATPase [Bacteroidales bacterium]
MHGNNEYPFVIDEKGIAVYPIVSKAFQQVSSSERISSGVKDLDKMLGKKGFFLGSSVLISGTAGTGKTSIATSFAYSVCKAGKFCLYCAFEEAPNQIIRNMSSIGFQLAPLVSSGLLTFYYARPSLQNLELHFLAIRKIIEDVKPSVVVLDPITNLMTEGPNSDIRSMLTRFVDYLKTENITVMFTAAITVGSIERNPSDEGISSMVDTWMMVQDIEVNAMRTRSLCVMKSRGMEHASDVRRFSISKKGITLSIIQSDVNGPEAIAKRKSKEHQSLSISAESIDEMESVISKK